MLNGWDFFGTIRCINLKSQNKRYMESKAFFEKYNIPVEYLRVDKNPESGERGCFESHISCIKESYKKGDEYCLIFEDDITADNSLNQESLDLAIDFMSKYEFDIFHFGGMPHIMQYGITKVTDNIIHGIFLNAEAYVISRKFMKFMSQVRYKNLPIDHLYANLANSYALYPGMFKQIKEDTDINNDFLENTGLKPLMHESAKKWAYHFNIPIVHLLLFISIILLILYFMEPKRKLLTFILVAVIFLFILWLVSDITKKHILNDKENKNKKLKCHPKRI